MSSAETPLQPGPQSRIQPDPAAVEAFGERLVGALNGASLMLMTSIGHRTGLFDALAGREPRTSAEIAADAGLSERYVREWLGAMVTGDIVRYDPEGGFFWLPDDHAALLTSDAQPNFAVSTQFFSVLGGVEDRIVDCFKSGGGVPYAAYPRFHEVMAAESEQTVVAALVPEVLPLAPGLIERLRSGIEVLDVGCGRGRAALELAERFPASRVAGYDFSEEAIADARAEAERRGLTNVRFEVADAARIDEPARYDLITAFDAIHDQARPDLVLAAIRKALKPDGTFLMQDIATSGRLEDDREAQPAAPFIYTISTMHCMTVSLACDGHGLGAAWGRDTALRMLDEAGFEVEQVHQLPHDFMNDWYVIRRG